MPGFVRLLQVVKQRASVMTMDREPTARSVSAADTRRLCSSGSAAPDRTHSRDERPDRPDRADAEFGMVDALHVSAQRTPREYAAYQREHSEYPCECSSDRTEPMRSAPWSTLALRLCTPMQCRIRHGMWTRRLRAGGSKQRRVVRCVSYVACCVLHDPLGLRQAEASSGQLRARSHASEDQPELHDALLDELLASADGACIDAAHMHRSMLPPDPSASSSTPTARGNKQTEATCNAVKYLEHLGTHPPGASGAALEYDSLS